MSNGSIVRLRRYLVTGLLIWLPIGVTIFVFRLLLGLMDRLLFLLPDRLRPEELLGFPVPGIGAALAIILLLGTGMLGAYGISKSADFALSGRNSEQIRELDVYSLGNTPRSISGSVTQAAEQATLQ